MSTPLSLSPSAPRGPLRALLYSAEMARAFTLTAIGAVFALPAILRLLGQTGAISVVAGLCLIGGAMLLVRRDEISWPRLLPSTLLLFLCLALASSIWSTDRGRSVLGWLALA
ncbi:MAG TPA: O-antigen ligase family protein, partial [Microbacteriaceae bacterium]|nr:O-antigen ligase family protein [Microbacteriaceae bacterium]